MQLSTSILRECEQLRLGQDCTTMWAHLSLGCFSGINIKTSCSPIVISDCSLTEMQVWSCLVSRTRSISLLVLLIYFLLSATQKAFCSCPTSIFINWALLREKLTLLHANKKALTRLHRSSVQSGQRLCYLLSG